MALTKKQIKEFKESEKNAKGSSNLLIVADELVEVGDKEWAKRVYKKAADKVDDCEDFIEIADSIHEGLGDKELLLLTTVILSVTF